MSIFSSGFISALSGLNETVVFSPLDLTVMGLAKISPPLFSLTLHLPLVTSITSPAKVLFSPMNFATKELTGDSYNWSGEESC